MKEERKSNFELLRILAMFLIILYHCFLHTNFTVNTEEVNYIEIAIQSIGMFGIAGNVIFTLISGYFLINNKKVKTKKIIQIILQSLTYSLVILYFFLQNDLLSINKKTVFQSFLPITHQYNWYISFYFILYILSPYINKLLTSLDKKSYKKMLLILFILWCASANIKSNAFLCNVFLYYTFVYSIGAYIRLYEKDISITTRNSVILLISTIFITIAALICFHLLATKIEFFYNYGINIIFKNHQSIFQLLIGLFTFLVFKNLKIESNKIINTISNCTLGVYLLHENYFVRKYIWGNMFKLNLLENSPMCILFMLAFCLTIFIVCTIIELIRKNTIEKMYMKVIDKYESKIDKFFAFIYTKYNNFLIFLGLEKKEIIDKN